MTGKFIVLFIFLFLAKAREGGFMRLPVAKEGFIFILFFLFLTFLAILAGSLLIGGVFFLMLIFVLFFFRDPERGIPHDKSIVVSPADGKLVQKRVIMAGEVLQCPAVCLSIFMSPFNVHINRMPVKGTIIKKKYTPGKFFPAYRDKASLLNEQMSLLIGTDRGRRIQITQIAGRIARRVVCRAKEGGTLDIGERFGIIMFGSRVDLFLPKENTIIYCKVGDRVRAGETILARFL